MRSGNRKYLFLFCSILISVAGLAQEREQKISFGGYVKDLQTLIFVRSPEILVSTALLHNRLNFKWFPGKDLTLTVEARNRLFWGDQVKLASDFLAQLDQSDDFLDLSLGFSNRKGIAGHFMLDRFYFEMSRGAWEVRFGRQRINWGISTVWNPNDLFNAFSFTDFDYEERPGSDALRIKYYTGFASSIELAAKGFRHRNEAVAAFMWRFNMGVYDIQILGGYARNDLVFGVGWAGNLGSMGFKGEGTIFHPVSTGGGKTVFSGTISLEHSFANSLFTGNGFLFNSHGASSANIADLFDFELSAKNLYPYKYSIFSHWLYPFTPLITGSVALIYSPSKTNALFLNPTFGYSIQENWDLNVVGQIVFESTDKYRSPIQALFLRVKFSF